MSSEIVLHGIGGDLILEAVINEHGWTRCYLAVGEQRIYLGAETIGFIVTRLLGELDDPSPKSESDLEGEKVHWVMGLSERHHVLYATDNQTDQKLIWQDAHDAPVKTAGIIIIGEEQKNSWREQLLELRTKWINTPQWLSDKSATAAEQGAAPGCL